MVQRGATKGTGTQTQEENETHGFVQPGKEKPNGNLTAAGCCLGKIIKKMQTEFCRDSHQNHTKLRQITTKEIMVGQKKKTNFLSK